MSDIHSNDILRAGSAPATLATVKHGGEVQLPTSERARFEVWAHGECLSLHRWPHSGEYSDDRSSSAWKAWQFVLSAQPSPGGQDAEQVLRRALQSAHDHGEKSAPFPMADCIRQTMEALAARQPVGEPLWCMHILGPDDVHAAPSKAHAEKAAAALNAFHASRARQSEHDPKVEAVVAPWPHSAESHAESVADFIPEWMLPRWQIEAIQTDAAPPAQQPAQVYLDGLDRLLGEAIDQRDHYHEVADDLAGHIAAITGVDIGEHSSANCPWQNAIEAAEEYKPAQAVDLAPKQPKLIGWRMADYTAETADPAQAQNWSANVAILPIFEGDPNTKLIDSQESSNG